MSSDGDQGNASKKRKGYCHFKESWKTCKFDVLVMTVKRTLLLSGSILSGKNGGDAATCDICGVCFSVAHGGAYDVVKYFSSKNHQKALTSVSFSQILSNFGIRNTEKAIDARKKERGKAESFKSGITVVQFIAEYNIHFRVGGHFTTLVKAMFPDSSIASDFQCWEASVMTKWLKKFTIESTSLFYSP